MSLMLAKKFGLQLDVTRLVYTMDVTETSGDGEVWGNWGEGIVDVEDVLGLCVKGVVVNILVVNTVLLASSDADFLELKSDLYDMIRISYYLPSRAIASLGQHA